MMLEAVTELQVEVLRDDVNGVENLVLIGQAVALYPLYRDLSTLSTCGWFAFLRSF